MEEKRKDRREGKTRENIWRMWRREIRKVRRVGEKRREGKREAEKEEKKQVDRGEYSTRGYRGDI